MNRTKQKLSPVLFICSINIILLFALFANLQATKAINPLQANDKPTTSLLHENNPPTGFGGGNYEFGHDHMSIDERAQIVKRLQENKKALGLIAPADSQGTPPVSLSFPLTGSAHFNDFGFHAIANFVDHDNGSNIVDYNCGDTTYNGHKGTDYFLWPFEWNKMDNEDVQVIAAAAGIIIDKQDGFSDRSCTWRGASDWNAVYISHADGSVAWYGHLKQGSVLTKSIGDSVAAGEYLGFVGSSGRSSGPHLHFELWQDEDYTQLRDPYAGSCNILNANSWWQEQRPYYDSAINKLTTGSAPIEFQACPAHDIINEKTEFEPGDYIVFTTYYRDQLMSQQSEYTIYRPDNTIFQQWTHNSDATHYNASWWWWGYTLPSDAQEGIWRFAVDYEGKQYEQPFSVKISTFITVTTPTDGKEWLPTETHTITWESSDTNNVNIDLYKGGTYSVTLATDTIDDGEFTWTVPLSPTLAPDYQIRVTDATTPAVFGESAYFAIGMMDKVYLPVAITE